MCTSRSATIGLISLRYLASIGEVVHYQDMDAIKDFVVVDPQWLTVDILGSLLSPDVENLQRVYRKYNIKLLGDGIISRADLVQVVQAASTRGSPISQAEASHVIDFLCRLEVCVEQAPDWFLIPSILEVPCS